MMYSSANQMALSRIGKSSSLVAAEGEARGRLKWFGVVRGYFILFGSGQGHSPRPG